MSDSEWEGETHTLIVHSVRLPEGPLDDGDLTDYDLEHPPSCKQESDPLGGPLVGYSCDIARFERNGLAETLRYSGTPITRPGTYKIRGWGRKYYVPDYGAYEHDAGVGVVTDEDGAADAK